MIKYKGGTIRDPSLRDFARYVGQEYRSCRFHGLCGKNVNYVAIETNEAKCKEESYGEGTSETELALVWGS